MKLHQQEGGIDNVQMQPRQHTHSFPHTHTLTLSLTHTLSFTHAHSLFPSHTPTLSFTHTRSNKVGVDAASSHPLKGMFILKGEMTSVKLHLNPLLLWPCHAAVWRFLLETPQIDVQINTLALRAPVSLWNSVYARSSHAQSPPPTRTRARPICEGHPKSQTHLCRGPTFSAAAAQTRWDGTSGLEADAPSVRMCARVRACGGGLRQEPCTRGDPLHLRGHQIWLNPYIALVDFEYSSNHFRS